MDEEKGLDDLAAYYDARMGEVDGLQPVKVRVSKQPRHVFSLRIGADELDKITSAAERQDISVGEFIRLAALKEADAGQDQPGADDESRDESRIERKLDEILERLKSA